MRLTNPSIPPAGQPISFQFDGQSIAALEGEEFHFYRWPWLKPSEGVAIRLVTSYATTEADVDDFLQSAARVS